MKEGRRKVIMSGLKVKHDCFAYSKELRKCKALNDLYCRNGECKFYKTEFQRCEECKTSRTKITCQECKANLLK